MTTLTVYGYWDYYFPHGNVLNVLSLFVHHFADFKFDSMMRIGSVKVAITTTQVRESLVTYFDNQLKPFMLVNLAFDAIFYLQRHFPHHK